MYAFDDAYLRRLTDGDPVTERHFFEYFHELLGIKLRRRLHQRQLVDDIRQETFARVIGKLRSPNPEDGLRHAERLGAFVVRVCENVMYEHLRASGRHPQIAEGAPESADQRVDAEQLLLNEERVARVREVIGRLSERDRRVLRALFVEDRDKDEICLELGVERGYLRVLLHRAKQQFRQVYVRGAQGRAFARQERGH